MLRSTVFSLTFVIGCFGLVYPGSAQPVTSSNGCHFFEAIATSLEFQPYGHLGSMQLQKASNGRLVSLVFECYDFPPEPEVVPEGIQRSVSICNWQMENGVKGTNRIDVRWFPDPQAPGRMGFTLDGQLVRGNRYPLGFISGQGEIDLAAGTISLDRWNLLACRELAAETEPPE